MAKKNNFRWSYSALGCWEACPLQYRYTYVEELPKPPNIYRDEGIRIHDRCEKYFQTKGARVPAELKLLKEHLADLKKDGAKAEVKICFDRDWQECAYEVRWGTVKIDVHMVYDEFLYVFDLKTGKVKDFSDQGRIYLGGALARYPFITSGVAEFGYSKTGDVLPGVGYPVKDPKVTVTQIRGFQREMSVRAGRMEKDRKLLPTPGAACRWCDFSKKRGGPCKNG